MRNTPHSHGLRHTVVCCAAQENGARTNEVSILTGTTKLRFSRIRSSVIPYPSGIKFTVELGSTREVIKCGIQNSGIRQNDA